jgi:Transposase
MTDEEVNIPKKGHTEEQIIAALKQYESGEKTADVCRKLGISQATFYMWEKQYAGLGVQELRECGNCAMRIAGSNGWWPIFRWTGRSCRRLFQKSCKASSQTPFGEVGRGGVSNFGASGRAVGENVIEHDAL